MKAHLMAQMDEICHTRFHGPHDIESLLQIHVRLVFGEPQGVDDESVRSGHLLQRAVHKLLAVSDIRE